MITREKLIDIICDAMGQRDEDFASQIADKILEEMAQN